MRRVAYRVDLARMEREILAASDSSRARPDYVGLLGYSVFGYLEGFESRPMTLEVAAPADWPIFTTLAPQATPPLAKATAEAADFYALADSQVAMGPALVVLRLENRVPLYLAAYPEGPVDLAFTGSLVAHALDALVAYFGSAPFPHYTAQVELLKPLSPRHGYGFSMEHLESSHYFLASDSAVTALSPEPLRRRVLFNFAHHIAHAWVPKRACGEGYFPFSWELAPLIDTIWLSEGFARYAAADALADAMPEAEALAYRKAALESVRATLAGDPAVHPRDAARPAVADRLHALLRGLPDRAHALRARRAARGRARRRDPRGQRRPQAAARLPPPPDGLERREGPRLPHRGAARPRARGDRRRDARGLAALPARRALDPVELTPVARLECRRRGFKRTEAGLRRISPLDSRQEGTNIPCRTSRRETMAEPKDSRSDLLQGTLDLLILRTLSAGPMHGWGISQRIQAVSDSVLVVNQGSLYPALYRLEEEGWVASEWGASENNRQAKFYRLTRSGERQLAREQQNWQRLASAVFRVLETA